MIVSKESRSDSESVIFIAGVPNVTSSEVCGGSYKYKKSGKSSTGMHENNSLSPANPGGMENPVGTYKAPKNNIRSRRKTSKNYFREGEGRSEVSEVR